MKKTVAFFLSICLLIGLMPVTAFAAPEDTANNEITQVEVEIEIPEVGAADNTVKFTSKNPDQYKVTTSRSSVWLIGNVDEASEFVNGNTYAANFSVTPESSYVLTQNTTVTVNGSDQGVFLTGGDSTPAAEFQFTTGAVLKGEITSVEPPGLPTGAVGTPAAVYSYDGTEYDVHGIWQYYDAADSTYKPMAQDARFANGGIYRLELTVDPEDGYQLSDACSLTIDGTVYDAWSWNHSALYGHYMMEVSHAQEIKRVDISKDTLPKAEIGMSFGTSFNVANESNYTITGSWHTYDDASGMDITSGTFEDGKVYFLRLEVRPKAGYSLSEGFEMWLGNAPYGIAYDMTMATAEVRTSFAKVITEAELLNLPVATPGEKLQPGVFPVTVPAGAAYTAVAQWSYFDAAFGWNGIDPSAGTDIVQSGKAYTLFVEILPNSGYEFAETRIIKAYGAAQKLSGQVPDMAYYTKEFSFGTHIAQVRVDGVTQPVVGATPSTAELKVPAGANYTIAHAAWFDADTGMPAAVFEAGHDYELLISVVPAEGYVFSQETVVLLDGKVPERYNADTSMVDMVKQFSFKEIISEIRIDNVPTMEVGQTARTDIKLPDGAKYKADTVMWMVWNDDAERNEPFSGTFETGKAYTLQIVVVPEDGYRFAEGETGFLVNGAESEVAQLTASIAFYVKEYAEGLKMVDRVELKIDAPVAGQHASFEPSVSIVNGTGVQLIDLPGALEWLAGNVEASRPFTGFFAADTEYGVHFVLRAEEGYHFAQDLVIVVNGVTLPADAVLGRMKTADVNYFFGMKNDESTSGGTGGVPQMGDTAGIGLWIGLMVASIAALAGCIVVRHKRKQEQ